MEFKWSSLITELDIDSDPDRSDGPLSAVRLADPWSYHLFRKNRIISQTYFQQHAGQRMTP
jgi:hypothetical protein